MNSVTIWTTLGIPIGGEMTMRLSKFHVHTEDPGLVMQEGLKYRSLVKVKVDNMRNQHEAQVEKEERQAKPVEEKNMPSSQL